MDDRSLSEILKMVAEGDLSPADAAEKLRMAPYEDMGFARVDTNRELRTGHSEVIFAAGKTPEQVAQIMMKMAESSRLIIATRAQPAHWRAAEAAFRESGACEKYGLTLKWHEQAKMIAASVSGLRPDPREPNYTGGKNGAAATSDPRGSNYTGGKNGAVATSDPRGLVAVVSAGTADIPVAEEAALTCEYYGNTVNRVFDVGVAGLHRLFDRIEDIRKADVVIAVAGMEGALASVLGGLVARPVIAVPTSVGYGASMGGLAALLAMLNSCSLGVSVMNIDNGFGAGYMASLITCACGEKKQND